MSTPALFEHSEDSSEAGLRETEAAGFDQPNATANRGTQSLYRRFRPQSFDADELVGQDAIVRTLRNAIQLDRVAHAYLFAGPRGTGKTTTARLLAKAVNCMEPELANRPCNTCIACAAIASGSAIDVIEIDAASNRGIDDIRELRERVKFAPAQLRTKFYIIDEAHQITGAAANAFLKTLEEPPAHTRFVLATTDPEQILPTIVSRCQIFEFKRIPLEATKRRLALVASREKIDVSQDAFDMIARQSGGSLRDALGLIDQLASYREHSEAQITVDDVRALLGMSRDELIVRIVEAIGKRNAAKALGLLQEGAERGADPRQVARQIVVLFRAIMHYLANPGASADDDVARVASLYSLNEAMLEAGRFSDLDFKVRHSSIPQLPLEIGIVAAVLREVRPGASTSVESLTPAESAMPSDQLTAQASVLPHANDQASTLLLAASLAERVRSSASTPHIQPAANSPAAGEGRETTRGETGGNAPSSEPSLLPVDQIRAQWDQIRADVKARSRRVDALLVSVDPVAIQGDTIVLASAYPFHRNKLSEPEVQSLVEDVIEKLIGQRMRVSTVLHSEAPAYATAQEGIPTPSLTQDSPLSPVSGTAADSTSGAPLSDEDQRKLDAARNIFDAEEIEL